MCLISKQNSINKTYGLAHNKQNAVVFLWGMIFGNANISANLMMEVHHSLECTLNLAFKNISLDLNRRRRLNSAHYTILG